MQNFHTMSRPELFSMIESLKETYEGYKSLGLKLDMSRGKPSPEQLDLSMGMLDVLKSTDSMILANGMDARNYGQLEGIPEARAMFAELMGIDREEVFICGNSSLNMMYDTVARAMVFGYPGGEKPWGQQKKLKFLCPVPGYDRHFGICEVFGIQMINVPMTKDGPDMTLVESWVNNDDTVKGIWCVPQYSNPNGVTYSDETVRRFANLKPAAGDFRIFWDNAYCVHHLTDDHPTVLNLMEECKKVGSEDMVIMFCSTSKISFSGAGVAAIGTSKRNMDHLKHIVAMQTISFDKLNQLRHVRFFKDRAGIEAHMEKHKDLLVPRFNAVIDTFHRELDGSGIATWTEPKGGYFISLDVLDGCAAKVIDLCAEAGVTLTGAGCAFPHHKDPRDRNIRIAPSYPSVEELNQAAEILATCCKLAAAEKLLSDK